MSVTNHIAPSDTSGALRTEIEQRVTATLADREFFQATVEALVDRVRYPHAAGFWEQIERRELDGAAEDRAAEDGATDDAHESAAGSAPDDGSTPEREHGGRTRRGKRAGVRRDRRQVED